MARLRRLLNALRPSRVERDIEREIAFHLQERTDALRRQGLDENDAHRQARLRFGNPAAQRERTREVDIANWLDSLQRSVRLAVRTLVRTPGFTIAVVLTLALGIGANTAVFSAVDTVLLRPLPFPNGDRLMLVMQTQEGAGETRIAPVRLEDWNRLNSTFEAITGYYVDDVVDTSRPLPERFRRAHVAPRFFAVLGVPPALGGGFLQEDHRYGGPIGILISDRRWRALGADPQVIERTVQIGNASISTRGVMPAGFQFPSKEVDIWTAGDVDAPWGQSRTLTRYTGIGRLREGVSLAQARADLARVQAQLAREHPDTDRRIGVRITPLKDTVVGSNRASLWLLFGAVSLLLLIACTNIAALLLSRTASREQEIAVRYSLGGSRAAVTAQLLTEASVLAFAGAAAGLAVAFGAASVIRAIATGLPRVDEIVIDARVLLYTAATTLAVALLCGLVPALRGSRRAAALPRPAHTHVPASHSMQWLLVGVQVALSVTLLAGAGLLVRSIEALSRVDSGLDPGGVLTLHVSGTYGWETTDQHVRRINRVMDEIEALPDVESVAITSTLPGVRDQEQVEFTLLEARGDETRSLVADHRVVSPQYFQVMRIPLVEGALCRRSPDAGGTFGATTEVMVNRRFVDRYLQGRPAIGLHLDGGLASLVTNGHLRGAAASRIVGIVGNARETSADREPAPTVYTCFSAPNPAPWYVIRTAGDPTASAATIRRAINNVEPQRSVYDIEPLERRIGDSYAQNRLRTWLLTLFALTALALVCAGVYGTLSYAVGLRRREVALRLALGALRRSVVRQLMSTGVRVVGAATACGLALALLFTQSLSAMLYGVSPNDPVTLTGVVAIVLSVAFLAALVPSARATSVPPMRALRNE